MKRRIALAVVAAAALAGAGWFGFNRLRTPDEAPRFYGNIDIREVDLGFDVGGRIERLSVDEGETVRAGAVIGELDAASLRAELAQARANAAALAARLQLLQAGETAENVAQSRAVVDERRAALRDAEADVRRLQPLRGTGAVAERDWENAGNDRDEAAARLRAAEQALADVRNGSRREEIAEARANYERALAQIETSRIRLEDAVLRAPSNGVVLTRAVEPGAIVAPGETAFTLSLIRPVWARIYVDAERLGAVAPGTPVRLTTDSAPGKVYSGRIGYVSPTAEFTPKTVETPELRTDLVYRARVVVLDPDSRLRQGMPVTVELARGRAAG